MFKQKQETNNKRAKTTVTTDYRHKKQDTSHKNKKRIAWSVQRIGKVKTRNEKQKIRSKK